MVVEIGRGIPVKDSNSGSALQKVRAQETSQAVPSKEKAKKALKHVTSDAEALVTQPQTSREDDLVAVVKAPPEVANAMSLAVVPSTVAGQVTSLVAVPPVVDDKDVETDQLLDGIHKVWGSRYLPPPSQLNPADYC
jgi:hypothetical protein